MRRIIIIFAVLILACRAFSPAGSIQPTPDASLTPPATATTFQPAASLTTVPYETATPPLLLTPTLVSPYGLKSQDGISYTVILHPDGGVYAGDLVSFEIVAPQGKDVQGRSIEIQIDPPQGEKLPETKFGGFGIANRTEATLTWAWNTQGLPAGDHVLSFSILPDGTTWTETIVLQPQGQVPSPEPEAHWATAKSDCCVLHFITGTEAERDLPTLLKEADEQASQATSRLGIDFNEPITVTLLPRVLGQGGFANQEISISYLDRNYAASLFSQVLQHEMVHILDGRLGGELRPIMLVEGLAVYITGGHYKPEEPLLPRAAALLELPAPPNATGPGWYIPLRTLADNFYPSQHEIGYLEAAALIEYMVKTWGWEDFSKFYRDIHPEPSKSQAKSIDQALQKHFQITFEELDQDFLQTLQSQEVPRQVLEDVRLTVTFYNTVRRYQQLLDLSAYFQTAWLLDNVQMRQRGIVADYLRHPTAPVNVALETLLISAESYLQQGKYEDAGKILIAVNNELDEVDKGPAREEGQTGS